MPPFWGASCISLYSIEIFHQLLIEYFRYEPTRYVIIASHHDSWHKGAARPGIGHAVLMELVRTLGYEARHNWKPGKIVPIQKKNTWTDILPSPGQFFEIFWGVSWLLPILYRY